MASLLLVCVSFVRQLFSLVLGDLRDISGGFSGFQGNSRASKKRYKGPQRRFRVLQGDLGSLRDVSGSQMGFHEVAGGHKGVSGCCRRFQQAESGALRGVLGV